MASRTILRMLFFGIRETAKPGSIVAGQRVSDGGVSRRWSSKGGRHVRSSQAQEFGFAASQSAEATSGRHAMPLVGHENGECAEAGSTKPQRRLRVLSETIDSIGTSFRKISRHVSNKSKNKLRKSESAVDISTPSEKEKDVSTICSERDQVGSSSHSKLSLTKSLDSSKSSIVSEDSSPSLIVSTLPRCSGQSSIRENSKIQPSRSVYSAKGQEFPTSPRNSSSSNKDGIPLKLNQRTDRRNSMIWVDYLTSPGLVIRQDDAVEEEESDSLNTSVEEEELQDKSKVHPTSETSGDVGNKRTRFNKTKEENENGEEDEENSNTFVDFNEKPKYSKRQVTGGFECPRSNFYRKMRKDSVQLSIKSTSRESPMPNGSNHQNVDDLIFDMFREKDEEVAIVGTFLAALAKTGLRKDDPRLAELFENLRRVHKDQEANFPGRIGSIETLRLDRETFKMIITDNIVLISKAFRQQFVIPEFQTFCGHLEEMYWRCRDVKGGKVAGYIPQLARVDPTLWGVSICTIDGQRFSTGDTNVPFTIQSCSKPLTYAIALNELGQDTVHQYVGQEPSGRMFNELVLDHNKKPHNPMVNAGAIIVCSLLKSMVRPEMSLAEKFDYTHSYFKKICGGEYVGFNNAVFLSEREAADRNFALGFYMRENKCFPEGTNLQECMDYYFQICSMECNCEAMSVMAATLANGGICPVSGEKVLKSESVRDVLSLMHSCGMYDYSGQFAFKVGLPAKSGVSGAIMLVVPNVFGMAVWSPPLDALGNSLRGVSLCQELVSVFNFHKYDNLRHASDKLDPRRHRYETKGLNIVNLLFSAAAGDVTSMRRHHLSGMDMNASDYDGRTALHLAAAEGHLECVQYLLRHCHVSHSPLDRWGHLPLDDATKFEHEEVADFLKKWAAGNPD